MRRLTPMYDLCVPLNANGLYTASQDSYIASFLRLSPVHKFINETIASINDQGLDNQHFKRLEFHATVRFRLSIHDGIPGACCAKSF